MKNAIKYMLPVTLCSMAAIFVYSLYTTSLSTLSSVMQTIRQTPTTDTKLRDSFISEVESINTHNNPEIDATIKYVWVLSARHSYSKKVMSSSPQNANAYDINDGFNRMNLGIDVARQVTAKKTGKNIDALTEQDIITHGPVIIYNAEEESNNVLYDVLAKGEISNYPKEMFSIFSLAKGEVHTKGQFISLKREDAAGKIALAGSTVALITHAYHWPRVGRTFGDSEGYDYLAKCKKTIAYLVDRHFKATGTAAELQAELTKLPSYLEKGFILRNINPTTQYNATTR